MTSRSTARQPRTQDTLAMALADLGARPITDLEAIAAEAPALSEADRLLVIDQAILLLERLYPHLAMKRVRHAIDPLQALRLLRARAGGISERSFHREMLRIFRSLRDIHTAYTPPPPYAHLSAFLPFLMEPCSDSSGNKRFLVTRLIKGFDHPTFREGVEIVSWHGAPVEKAVARHAAEEVGANPDARRALGNLFMTVRWLGASLMPNEDWVILGYRTNRGEGGEELEEIRLPWSLIDLKDDQLKFAIQSLWRFEESSTDPRLDRALDVRSHTEQVTRRALFAEAGQRCREQIRARAAVLDAPPPDLSSTLGHLFAAELIHDPSTGTSYGYLRLRAFQHSSVREFRDEFRRLVSLMPRSGLVLDLRSNPGGVVRCAESLLQLLTPRPITPLLFRFLSTDLTSRLSEPLDSSRFPISQFFPASMKRKEIQSNWGETIGIARSTGALFSGGAPLTTVEEANEIGQEYFAPVVLIIDAITYSAGDIFAAGFVDHAIGPVLGVDTGTGGGADKISEEISLTESTKDQATISTGGGGANVWEHAELVHYLPDEPDIRPLPGGCQIRLAARICERTGSASGMPIEELGVPATARHILSDRDIRGDNPDLKAAAIALLAKSPRYWLDVTYKHSPGDKSLLIEPSGIDRLDIYLDDRPLRSIDTAGTSPLEEKLPTDRTFSRVEVRGFADGELVACRRLTSPPHPG